MKIDGVSRRTVWRNDDRGSISVIDQTLLPHQVAFRVLSTRDEAANAIRTMVVRGAPLIGVTAAFGLALALQDDASDTALSEALEVLRETRPTAVNLHWTLALAERELRQLEPSARAAAAWALAERLADEDVEINAAIGQYGETLIVDAARRKGKATVNISTHCNAGWLGTVDWGTALAPIYRAHDSGLAVHVYADETRPRLQGAALTAFELGQHGVPHTVIADGASGHVMRSRGVDLVIVGCDRVAANGDTANKIGTYMLALAAHDNDVPFYVALPSRTVDLSLAHGGLIPVEERDEDEVLQVSGRQSNGELARLSIAAPGASAFNPAFDITPARLITGFITEFGLLRADELHRLAMPQAA